MIELPNGMRYKDGSDGQMTNPVYVGQFLHCQNNCTDSPLREFAMFAKPDLPTQSLTGTVDQATGITPIEGQKKIASGFLGVKKN